MAHSTTGGGAIDISLRFWSEHLPLEEVINEIGINVDILHIAGRPVSYGRMAGRLAKRHYAAIAGTNLETDAQVILWCNYIINKIYESKSIVNQLILKTITATVWIAVTGHNVTMPPKIPYDIIQSFDNLKIGVLVEDYTVLDDGNPRRSWLSRPFND